MAWTAKATKGGGDYEKAPPGNHPAVLVAMIDLGTQKTEFGGEVKEQHRVFWVWELVTEKTKTGLNHLIGMDLTFSLNENAKMRAFVEARLSRKIGDDEEYDVETELGKPCLLNVVEKKGYPKVETMSSVPKGMTVARPTHPLTLWKLEEFEKTGKIDIPGWIPWLYGESIPAHIARCLEMDGRKPEVKTQDKPASSRPAPPSSNGSKAPTYWADLGGGRMNDDALDREALTHLLVANGLNETTPVCQDGTNEWKPARDHGITLPL